MRLSCFFALIVGLAQAPFSLAQDSDVTVIVSTVTLSPSSSASTGLSQSTTSADDGSSSTDASSSQSLASVTSTSLPATSTSAANIQPASVQSTAASSTTSAGGDWTGGYPQSQATGVDTSGGASGSDSSSFDLSKGAVAAIITVCVLVVIFGGASAALYFVAKRRQWNIRQSIARASRRLTGRSGAPKSSRGAPAVRQSRRAGAHFNASPEPDVRRHKRGLVVDVRDVEKGPKPLEGKAPKNTRPRERTWMKTLWGDGWK